jgi:hypothetical protein
MLIVKRPFRNFGKVLTVGSVLTEPAEIKHLKARLGDGHIIEIAEHDLDKFHDYFLQKFGVDIIENFKKVSKVTEVVNTKIDEVKTDETIKVKTEPTPSVPVEPKVDVKTEVKTGEVPVDSPTTK